VRIVVTGANGFIGHALLEALFASNKREFVAVDKAPFSPGLDRLVANAFSTL